eukprot:2207655-Pleurochrysis_carterae.AAC.1
MAGCICVQSFRTRGHGREGPREPSTCSSAWTCGLPGSVVPQEVMYVCTSPPRRCPTAQIGWPVSSL